MIRFLMVQRILQYISGIFLLLLLISSAHASPQENLSTHKIIIKNINDIDTFFAYNGESLPYEQIIELAKKVIKSKKKYNHTTIAQSFSLLSDAAIYKGDSAKSLRFAQQGLQQGLIKRNVQLTLLIKVIKGFYATSKYKQVISTVKIVTRLSKNQIYLSYRLTALGYEASASALLGHYKKAYQQLQFIDKVLDNNPSFANQLALLQILAIANHDLGNYKTSIMLHLKLLKFDQSQKDNIEQTYYNLATAYLKLGKYDDAYNAFWQVELISKKKLAPLLLAYAKLGMGETLLKQGHYSLAYNDLVKAEKLFNGKHLTKPYISVLLALAIVAKQTNRGLFASQLLQKAEKLSQGAELTRDQTKLYQLLSVHYKEQGNYRKALIMLNKYLQRQEQFRRSSIKAKKLTLDAQQATEKSKKLALKLSEKGFLYAEFSKKNKHLLIIIKFLFGLIVLLIISLFYVWLKHRNYLLRVDYNEIEHPIDYMPNSLQTKKYYQKSYQQARFFNYPLTITYLKVDNWSKLSFHFNKKIMDDIAATIATRINNQITEFDYVGLINNGEYILLFPHRTKAEVEVEGTIKKLSDELNALIFANLGKFSVIISVVTQTPNVQDIDPFAFLAQFSDLFKKRSSLK